MFNGQSSCPSLFNCIFNGNSAERGGGMFNLRDSSGSFLSNCTFSGNSARLSAAGVYSYGEMTAKNCIFWGNVGPAIVGKAMVTYSDIQGGWPGQGNIDADPCFAESGRWINANDPNQIAEPNDPNAVWVDGDYHLKSQAGRWYPDSNIWFQDDQTSPCIDAGDPDTPFGDEPFPNGDRINMGAYGGTTEASKSPSN
jgi:hypothetical protein